MNKHNFSGPAARVNADIASSSGDSGDGGGETAGPNSFRTQPSYTAEQVDGILDRLLKLRPDPAPVSLTTTGIRQEGGYTGAPLSDNDRRCFDGWCTRFPVRGSGEGNGRVKNSFHMACVMLLEWNVSEDEALRRLFQHNDRRPSRERLRPRDIRSQIKNVLAGKHQHVYGWNVLPNDQRWRRCKALIELEAAVKANGSVTGIGIRQEGGYILVDGLVHRYHPAALKSAELRLESDDLRRRQRAPLTEKQRAEIRNWKTSQSLIRFLDGHEGEPVPLDYIKSHLGGEWTRRTQTVVGLIMRGLFGYRYDKRKRVYLPTEGVSVVPPPSFETRELQERLRAVVRDKVGSVDGQVGEARAVGPGDPAQASEQQGSRRERGREAASQSRLAARPPAAGRQVLRRPSVPGADAGDRGGRPKYLEDCGWLIVRLDSFRAVEAIAATEAVGRAGGREPLGYHQVQGRLTLPRRVVPLTNSLRRHNEGTTRHLPGPWLSSKFSTS